MFAKKSPQKIVHPHGSSRVSLGTHFLARHHPLILCKGEPMDAMIFEKEEELDKLYKDNFLKRSNKLDCVPAHIFNAAIKK